MHRLDEDRALPRECEWKRGDGQPKRPSTLGPPRWLDQIAFSWRFHASTTVPGSMILTDAVVAILTVTLAVSPAQACACGVPDWSVMSAEEIVSAINGAEDEPRIMAGQSGQLPPAPPGYRYDENYTLVSL